MTEPLIVERWKAWYIRLSPEVSTRSQLFKECIEELSAAEQKVEQLHRIVKMDKQRADDLRGTTPWHAAVWPDRPDFLAWREASQGIEILCYNNGLCDPIWIAQANAHQKGKTLDYLREKVERLSAPVSDAEWDNIFDASRESIDAIIAARLTDKEKA